MREVTLSDGKTITVRGLRRSEIKRLAEYGFGYLRCDLFSLPKQKQDEGIDAVLSTQFTDADLGDLENPDLMEVFNSIVKATYSSGEEEKNSLPSGPSDQTAPDGSTAAHA